MLTFEQFRIWCLKNNKERKHVAVEADISLPTVHNIFNDKLPVRTDTIEKLCKTYKLRIEEVMEYREESE